MKILVLGGSHGWAAAEVRFNHGSDVEVKLRPQVTVSKGDTIVHYVSVRTERDADCFRGLRYDLIVEDGSFNPERSFVKGDLLRLVQAMVLR